MKDILLLCTNQVEASALFVVHVFCVGGAALHTEEIFAFCHNELEFGSVLSVLPFI